MVAETPGSECLFIQRAPDSQSVFRGYVCIDLGGLNVGMPEKVLDRPNVITVFKKMCRKTVAKYMHGHPFG